MWLNADYLLISEVIFFSRTVDCIMYVDNKRLVIYSTEFLNLRCLNYSFIRWQKKYLSIVIFIKAALLWQKEASDIHVPSKSELLIFLYFN